MRRVTVGVCVGVGVGAGVTVGVGVGVKAGVAVGVGVGVGLGVGVGVGAAPPPQAKLDNSKMARSENTMSFLAFICALLARWQLCQQNSLVNSMGQALHPSPSQSSPQLPPDQEK